MEALAESSQRGSARQHEGLAAASGWGDVDQGFVCAAMWVIEKVFEANDVSVVVDAEGGLEIPLGIERSATDAPAVTCERRCQVGDRRGLRVAALLVQDVEYEHSINLPA